MISPEGMEYYHVLFEVHTEFLVSLLHLGNVWQCQWNALYNIVTTGSLQLLV